MAPYEQAFNLDVVFLDVTRPPSLTSGASSFNSVLLRRRTQQTRNPLGMQFTLSPLIPNLLVITSRRGGKKASSTCKFTHVPPPSSFPFSRYSHPSAPSASHREKKNKTCLQRTTPSQARFLPRTNERNKIQFICPKYTMPPRAPITRALAGPKASQVFTLAPFRSAIISQSLFSSPL